MLMLLHAELRVVSRSVGESDNSTLLNFGPTTPVILSSTSNRLSDDKPECGQKKERKKKFRYTE